MCFADAYNRGHIQTREVSAREKLPPKFMESILSALTRGKFLVSKIGASGGYRLARPPKEIMLRDIIERLEGTQLLEEAEEIPHNERPGEIAVRLIESRLSSAVREVLESTTLADLTEQVALLSKSGQMYYI